MFSIHDMTTDTGLPSDNADDECPTAGPNQVRLPSILNLSYERYVPLAVLCLVNVWSMRMLEFKAFLLCSCVAPVPSLLIGRAASKSCYSCAVMQT
jgi:hypothetical protein